MEPLATLEVEPIGWVRNSISDSKDVTWKETESQIVIEERFAEALEGIEEFSHIVVIFWFHRKKREGIPLRVHPRGRKDMPLVGIFATRAPVRPNPIGLTVVPLLERRGNTLRVRGLDAYDGTPLLDLKPYLLRGDHIPEPGVPGWLRRLWENRDHPKR